MEGFRDVEVIELSAPEVDEEDGEAFRKIYMEAMRQSGGEVGVFKVVSQFQPPLPQPA